MPSIVAAVFANPLTQRIAGFLLEIGLPVEAGALGAPTLLPGVTVARGVIVVDEPRLAHPGDLLHEAGHLAVCDPAARAALETVGDDPGEEMAALAWSYAAARHLGIDPAVVFHPDGYRGDAAAILAAFQSGATLGQPMLEWFGMTLGPKAAGGAEPFPHMLRWLR